ncbi:unnamed protein product [Anisakis simplex]|uniref:PH domain-containing protein n=1 Tax=Anisakis simplex TaxID=6269 RepID=A0A0M3K8P0_ANISI|nr:unnamed protein product [Anisakis simplex]
MTLKKRLRNARRRLACISSRPPRNQTEVGQACRGSINLQEARIHTDNATNSLTITASSQTFHLKAQNECDRKQWLTALEYARHRAIRDAESDEDEDMKMNSASNGGMIAVDHMNKALSAKLDDLRTCNKLIAKHGSELARVVNELEQNEKTRILSERISLFKITAAAMLNACDEFVSMLAKETRRIGRYAANEHEQRIRLQDQLEELAQQHSNLERAAYRTARESDFNSETEPR